MIDRTCEQCQKFIYKDDKKRLSSEKRTNRFGVPWPRPSGIPTPCGICPKYNPDRGRQVETAIPKAMVALDRYWQTKGSAGRCLTEAERNDAIVKRNLGIVEQLVKAADFRRLAEIVGSI